MIEEVLLILPSPAQARETKMLLSKIHTQLQGLHISYQWSLEGEINQKLYRKREKSKMKGIRENTTLKTVGTGRRK